MSYVGDGGGDVGTWNPTGIVPTGPHAGIVQFGNPNAAVVVFYKRSIVNPIRSEREGVRRYDDVDYVRVQHPGEKEQVVDRPVNNADKQRWPLQWKAYSENREQTPIGIPIDLLFPSHPAIADNLRACNVQTIEQLAALSSSGMDSVGMGAQDYVNYAKQYLDTAHRGVGFHQMQAELKKRDDEIRSLSNTVNILKGQLEMAIQAMAGKREVRSLPLPQGPVSNPNAGALPPIPGAFDPQTSAINANHPSAEIVEAVKKKGGRPKRAR
jgi:hypothetical protein